MCYKPRIYIDVTQWKKLHQKLIYTWISFGYQDYRFPLCIFENKTSIKQFSYGTTFCIYPHLLGFKTFQSVNIATEIALTK